jgi:hypothetical protein
MPRLKESRHKSAVAIDDASSFPANQNTCIIIPRLPPSQSSSGSLPILLRSTLHALMGRKINMRDYLQALRRDSPSVLLVGGWHSLW